MRASIERRIQRERTGVTLRTVDRIGAVASRAKIKRPSGIPRRRSTEEVPLVAGNFQGKDEIELRVTGQNLMNGTVQDMNTLCVVYIAKTDVTKEELKPHVGQHTKSGEGRDETEDSADHRDELPKDCVELGRTEVQRTPDPVFETAVGTTFSVHKLRDIVVAIYLCLNHNEDDLSMHRLLGCARFGLHRLVSSGGACESDPLKSGGRICVSARPTDSQCQNLQFRFAGRNLGLKPKHKRNAFVVVSYLKRIKAHHRRGDGVAKESHKVVTAAKWEVIWKSDVVRGSAHPLFNFGQFPISKMSGDDDTPICITFMDYDDKYFYHTVIGQVKTTYQQLLHSAGFALTHNKKKTGIVAIDHIDTVYVPTLSHYLSEGGLVMDLMVAIDFTKNNVPRVEDEKGSFVQGGEEEQVPLDYRPNSAQSLHRLRGSGKLNGYQVVLCSIAEIFQQFSRTKSLHAWGFGGVNAKGGAVKHRLHMGHEGGCVKGAEGLLEAYTEIVSSGILMSSPKDLRKTLYTAIARAELNASSTFCYSVLLIVCCEGFVNALNETMEQICEASYEPISIIFVGVGGGNFSDFVDMQKEQKVSPSGKPFMRECVQFVQLEEHKHDIAEFSHAVFEELPKQVVQYHLSKKILPRREVEDQDSENDSTVHPHLMADYVDMTDISAYVSPSLSYDSCDVEKEAEANSMRELVTASYSIDEEDETVYGDTRLTIDAHASF